MLNLFPVAFLEQASPLFWLLMVLSVVVMAIGGERLVCIYRAKRRLLLAQKTILTHLQAGDLAMAQAVNLTVSRHPATDSIRFLLQPISIPHTNGRDKMLLRQHGCIMRHLQARVWLLGSVGTMAPFVGLLGTVLGIMQAFHTIQTAQSSGFQAISSGLSEALITTAAGIFVGIEAVIFFNVLQVGLSDYSFVLRRSFDEIGDWMKNFETPANEHDERAAS